MRTLATLLLLSPILAAQSPQTAAFLRGLLVDRDAQPSGGAFSVRVSDNLVVRYQFDALTYVEREDKLIDVPRLRPGEQVEVVSDQLAGAPLRYARTVHVIPIAPPPRPLSKGRLRAYRPDDDRAVIKGDLTFSGVVAHLTGGNLVLHTRDSGDQTILLLPDTRYLRNGEPVGLTDLKDNLRVFVRAGKNAHDRVEAYQVVWGTILDPR